RCRYAARLPVLQITTTPFKRLGILKSSPSRHDADFVARWPTQAIVLIAGEGHFRQCHIKGPISGRRGGNTPSRNLVWGDQMRKYLVTGACGFIGSALVRALIDLGESVRALDDLSTGKLDNIAGLGGAVHFRKVSLLDPARMAAACEGVECIFHQAAVASVPRSGGEPKPTKAVEREGTLNLLIAARDAGVKRVIYAASSSAYGESEVLPKREDMVPHPISPYAVQKLAAEHYMQVFSRVYGLETVSLRYFNVFGPRQD